MKKYLNLPSFDKTGYDFEMTSLAQELQAVFFFALSSNILSFVSKTLSICSDIMSSFMSMVELNQTSMERKSHSIIKGLPGS